MHSIRTAGITVAETQETLFRARGAWAGSSSGGLRARPCLRPAQPLAGAARCTEHVRAPRVPRCSRSRNHRALCKAAADESGASRARLGLPS